MAGDTKAPSNALDKNPPPPSPPLLYRPPTPNPHIPMAQSAARAGDIPLLRQAFEENGVKASDVAIQALDNGSPQLYAYLLDACGLDPNHRFPGYSGSALICAARFAKLPLMRLLLDRGADPNLPNVGWGGQRLGALACAAGSVRKEAPQAVRMLLEAGARWEGSGAVQVASMKGLVGNVRVLLEEGKGVDVVGDVNGKVGRESAMAMARKNGHEDVVELLGRYGGVVE